MIPTSPPRVSPPWKELRTTDANLRWRCPSELTRSISGGCTSARVRRAAWSWRWRSTRSCSAASSIPPSRHSCPVRSRRVAHDRRRLRPTPAVRRHARGSVHALPRAGGAGVQRRRPRGLPAGRGRGARVAVRRGRGTRSSMRGRATRWRWRSRRRCCAGPTAPVYAPSAASISTQQDPITGTSASPTRAGRSCRNCGSSNLIATMAVPKQKQSHARTSQRRAQHKVSAPTYNACPQCHSPRLPHRVCPVCGYYKGREVIALGADEPHALTPARMVTVAVDAGGADLGPQEVAEGATRAAAQGIGVLLFGPASEIRSVGAGVEVIDAPVSIAKAADPAFAVRSTPEASIVQAARAVAEGRAQALVSGGSTGSALGRRAVQPPPRPRHLPAGAGAARADAGRRAGAAARRRRQRHVPARTPRAVRAHGLGVRPGGDGDRVAAGGAALERRGAGQGHAGARHGARTARG